MSGSPDAPRKPVGPAHRLIDSLTAIKLRIGSLRSHLQREDAPPEAIDEVLAEMERDLETAAQLAQVLQAREDGAE